MAHVENGNQSISSYQTWILSKWFFASMRDPSTTTMLIRHGSNLVGRDKEGRLEKPPFRYQKLPLPSV